MLVEPIWLEFWNERKGGYDDDFKICLVYHHQWHILSMLCLVIHQSPKYLHGRNMKISPKSHWLNDVLHRENDENVFRVVESFAASMSWKPRWNELKIMGQKNPGSHVYWIFVRVCIKMASFSFHDKNSQISQKSHGCFNLMKSEIPWVFSPHLNLRPSSRRFARPLLGELQSVKLKPTETKLRWGLGALLRSKKAAGPERL